MVKKPFPIHTILLAIFPILFIFAQNIHEAAFAHVLLPAAISGGTAFLLLLSFRLVFKDNLKAGLLVSLILILFFSYGHLYRLVWDKTIGGLWRVQGRHLLLVWGILFASGSFYIIKTRRQLGDFTKVVNVFALSVVAISLINIGVYRWRARTVGNPEDREAGMVRLPPKESLSAYPDIYYIIMDGYASADILKEVYGFDNSPFVNFLTEKGFYVAPKSASNYVWTTFSLASSLNLEYLNYLSDRVGTEAKDLKPIYRLIEDNKVIGFLKSRGYQYLHFLSFPEPWARNQYADFNYRYKWWLSEFALNLRETSMLEVIEKHVLAHVSPYLRDREYYRAPVLEVFSRLAEIPRLPGPKFVFAYILPPHPPYVFGAQGEPVMGTALQFGVVLWEEKQNYLNQLTFVNQKIKSLLETILANSRLPPVIILQADHGSRAIMEKADFSARAKDAIPFSAPMLRERMRIFNAYYLPRGGKEFLYGSISPVNTFRIIFNCCFDAHYELLKDRCFFSHPARPYKFIEVTDAVRQE